MKDYRTWWRKEIDSAEPLYRTINLSENMLSKVTGAKCYCSACNFDENEIKYNSCDWDCLLEQLWAIKEGLAEVSEYR